MEKELTEAFAKGGVTVVKSPEITIRDWIYDAVNIKGEGEEYTRRLEELIEQAEAWYAVHS